MPAVRKVSRAEMLRTAEKLAQEYGESLTITAFRRETGWSQWTILDRFGDRRNLRRSVGLTAEAPRTKNRVSRERIIELMRTQAAVHGEELTEWTLLKATVLSGRVIADRFGSLAGAAEADGKELESPGPVSRRGSVAGLGVRV